MIKTYEIDLDDKLVENASKIFESLGTDIDSAIKIFLTQAILRKGFPFELAVPDDKSEEIKSENLIEENVVEAISENKAENENGPELSQDENISEVPDSVKIAELKKDLLELSENSGNLGAGANTSSSVSEQNSNPEDEDETTPENLFEQWKAQN